MEHARLARGLVVLAPLLVLSQVGPTSAGTTPAAVVPLVPLSARKLEHCERSALLRPVCPRVVPRVSWYLSNLSVELAGLGGPVLDVFNLEGGGEFPRNPERNRPPRMAHVVAVAGNVERLAPFREPRGARREQVQNGVMRRTREAPVSFGRVRWAGRVGALYLAPPFPSGGMLGNHLVFSWRERGLAYALSLHAWEPLAESAATLQAMVDGLPTSAEAERLVRLSPTRRLTMPRGPATVRARITAPSPREYAFDVFVITNGGADIGVRIVTSSGEVLRVLDSTQRFGRCNVRPPLRTCLVRFPKRAVARGGTWTIVATKRSDPPARARVDISFISFR